jgi:hypothetical protein
VVVLGKTISLVSKCRRGTCFVCHRKRIHSECKFSDHSFQTWERHIKSAEGCDMEFNNCIYAESASENDFFNLTIYKVDFNWKGWPVKMNLGLFRGYGFTSKEYAPRESSLSTCLKGDVAYLVNVGLVNNKLQFAIKWNPDKSKIGHIVRLFLRNREYFFFTIVSN